MRARVVQGIAITGFAIAVGANPETRNVLAIGAVLLAGLAGAVVTERIRGGPALMVIGVVVAAVAVWLLPQHDDVAAATILSALFAMGVSLVVHSRPVDADAPGKRGGVVLAALLLVVTLVFAAYIGAETPAAAWFGGGTTHGPTDKRQVAITFDDGPDAMSTPQVMAILDRYGVKATFFEVGKAIDAAPDVTRALHHDGQLLGNHSYHHDQWRWLDPRYPELQRTQDAFERAIGTCPVLYRPPHGDRTPFLARVVKNHDMHMVLWNVSAGDWSTNDAQLVAERILSRRKARRDPAAPRRPRRQTERQPRRDRARTPAHPGRAACQGSRTRSARRAPRHEGLSALLSAASDQRGAGIPASTSSKIRRHPCPLTPSDSSWRRASSAPSPASASPIASSTRARASAATACSRRASVAAAIAYAASMPARASPSPVCACTRLSAQSAINRSE